MKTVITPRFALMLAVAVGLFFLISGCQSFDPGNYIKVNTPVSIQQSDGLPSKLTLNEWEVEYEAWFNDKMTNGTAWKGNGERARESAQLFRSLSLQTASELIGTEAVAAIPGLTLLLGLFMRRPGDVSNGDASEREKASFNKGQKVMLEALERQASRTEKSDAHASELVAAVRAMLNKSQV